MTVHSREYRGEADYNRVLDLLRESYKIAGPWFSWSMEHWHLLHNAIHYGEPGWEAGMRVWETSEGKLVGVVIPEGGKDIYLQVHPDYRQIEPEMLDWAEARFGALKLFAAGWDERRYDLLAARGYANKGPAWNHYRYRFGEQPVPAGQLPPGYRIRSLNREDPEERMRVEVCSVATWGRGGEANPDLATLIAQTRSYRQDLDLVVEAPDGSIAAFCIVWYDPELRIGIFEPVGTHPNHRRLGLGKSMMWEGFRRTEALGAKAIYVTAWATSPHANALYRSTGAVHVACDIHWTWEPGAL
ncbi:MAG TPA: GNAT family N-acetyltransferase [Symbiobacteriaceae bacterium]|nr:GNAT family N-acetyltransferase [Symbiobacteriaceae bacterium]